MALEFCVPLEQPHELLRQSASVYRVKDVLFNMELTMGKGFFLHNFQKMPGQVNRTQGMHPGMNELFLCDVVFVFKEKKQTSLSDLDKVISSVLSGGP